MTVISQRVQKGVGTSSTHVSMYEGTVEYDS